MRELTKEEYLDYLEKVLGQPRLDTMSTTPHMVWWALEMRNRQEPANQFDEETGKPKLNRYGTEYLKNLKEWCPDKYARLCRTGKLQEEVLAAQRKAVERESYILEELIIKRIQAEGINEPSIGMEIAEQDIEKARMQGHEIFMYNDLDQPEIEPDGCEDED
jgi:hypothetical protein